MARYLITFDAHAMDHVGDQDLPAVSKAAHAVVREAIEAGVWVFGAGVQDQVSRFVDTNGSVTDGAPPAAVGGFCIVEVPTRDEALAWAAKTAQACRCAQEVWELGDDPETDAMVSAARG